MRKYTAYIIAAAAGLCLSPLLMAAKGYEYTINGRDLLNAVLCVLIVYLAKAAWELRPRKQQKRRDPIAVKTEIIKDDDKGAVIRIRLDTDNAEACKLYAALGRNTIKAMSFRFDNDNEIK